MDICAGFTLYIVLDLIGAFAIIGHHPCHGIISLMFC